ncbi:MAG TPA: hypothetical protein PK677_11255 [Acidiphilium sp.]|nr:hypothetical protein [Acidiphilium sp.]
MKPLAFALTAALRYAAENPRIDLDAAIEASLRRDGWHVSHGTPGSLAWPHQVARPAHSAEVA